MGKAVAKRHVSATIGSPSRNRGQVLKFDRHAGLVMMEKEEPATKWTSMVTLVRNLLSFLRLIPSTPTSRPRAKAGRNR